MVDGWEVGMRGWKKVAFITSIVLILSMMVSSCELPKTLYKIKLILGHGNQNDLGKISIWVTGMEPGDGGKNLGFNEWYPSAGHLDYEVYLSKPKDFTVYVESETNSYSRSFEIEDGEGYSFYYESIDPSLAIQGHTVNF
ncbi:MAG: hypothetical protein PHT55_07250 [Spirochaetales bacterium]|nr:hypothetical protein [Spirochaetales bacterium]